MPVREAVWLLPGLLCDAFVWRAQIEALGNAYDVHVADFYGFDSITEMAEAVLSRATSHFALAGHSMGGRVAMEITRLAPERVSRLMLLDTGYRARAPGETEKRQRLVDLANGEGMAALAATWLPPMVHPDRINDTSLMVPLSGMVCRATPEIFAGQVRALLHRPDATAVLAALECPTTFVCGRQDGWSPVAQHEEMRALVPRADLVVVEEAGHMTTVEQPAAVTAALEAWFSS